MPNATFITMSLSRITVILSTITVITLSNRIAITTMPFSYSHHVHPLHSSAQPHRDIMAKTNKRITALPVSHPLYYSVQPHRHITNTNKQANKQTNKKQTNNHITLPGRYPSTTGIVACPEDPESCPSPPEWYPDLDKPLGAPMGQRVEVAPYVWTREFEHATVHLNLNRPNESKVLFR
jgi:hypothetical protein